MAKETKKDPTELTIEEKLKNLYDLQTMLSEIDKIRTLRGELPLEVQDLEDEIEGLSTRIEKIQNEIVEAKRDIANRKSSIEANNATIEKYKEQLDNVRNNREYESLSKEIEFKELENQLSEKRIREANAAIDHKNQEIQHCNDEMTERRTDLDIKKRTNQKCRQAGNDNSRSQSKNKIETFCTIPKWRSRQPNSQLSHTYHKKIHQKATPNNQACFFKSPHLRYAIINNIRHRENQQSASNRQTKQINNLGFQKICRYKAYIKNNTQQHVRYRNFLFH